MNAREMAEITKDRVKLEKDVTVAVNCILETALVQAQAGRFSLRLTQFGFDSLNLYRQGLSMATIKQKEIVKMLEKLDYKVELKKDKESDMNFIYAEISWAHF